MDVGVVLELPAPRVQDPGKPWEIGPDEARVCGQPFEGRCRRLKHGVIRDPLMRADEGTQGLRDSESEEEVRPGKLLLEVVCEPLLGFMLRTLRTMTIATGMMDAVLSRTTWALREAVSVISALAVLDGTDSLAVGEREVRRTLQVFWRKGGADIAEGGHGRSPCMRVLRRS
jgi:hypothetical protein